MTPEELERIKSLGGLEKLIEAFRKAREKAEAENGEDQEGQQGNADRPGSGGPGGPGRGKKKKAKKVWDQRQYKNLDDAVEIGTRNIKMALRRLRKFARTGEEEELTWTTPSAPPPTMAACSISRCGVAQEYGQGSVAA